MEFLFFSFSSLPQTLKLLFDQDFEISGQNKYIYIYIIRLNIKKAKSMVDNAVNQLRRTNIAESQNISGSDPKDHFIPTLCCGQGHLPPAQVAQLYLLM